MSCEKHKRGESNGPSGPTDRKYEKGKTEKQKGTWGKDFLEVKGGQREKNGKWKRKRETDRQKRHIKIAA